MIPECQRIVSRSAPFYKKFCISGCVMCSYCLSFFFYGSFPSHDELLIMFTKERPIGQYENQNVSRPNHDFCHSVVDFKEILVGGRLECQTSMF